MGGGGGVVQEHCPLLHFENVNLGKVIFFHLADKFCTTVLVTFHACRIW